MRLFSILCLMGITFGLTSSYALSSLDDNYFGNGSQPRNSPGTQVLDPDFFTDSKGTLEKAPAGEYGCTSVWARTPKAESARLGKASQSFCASAPHVTWIPRLQSWTGVPSSYNNNDWVAGYYQICCVKKSLARRGRPRVPR